MYPTRLPGALAAQERMNPAQLRHGAQWSTSLYATVMGVFFCHCSERYRGRLVLKADQWLG